MKLKEKYSSVNIINDKKLDIFENNILNARKTLHYGNLSFLYNAILHISKMAFAFFN